MAASAKTLTIDNHTLDGDWTVVLPRRGKQRRHSFRIRSPEQLQQQQQQKPWAPIDLETDAVRKLKLMQKMQICMKKMENSLFYHTLLDQIQTPEIFCCFHRVLGSEMKMQMVIYGVGSIELYEPPRLQLSLAILLKRKFSWIGDIEVFDPVLSTTECQVLEALGCSVLSINEQGQRCAQKPTMFFMPHCESMLYDNLLRANWGVELLNHVVLFGNSFDAYEKNVSYSKNSAMVDSTRHILAIRQSTKEFGIQTVSDDYFGAFHTSSWHFFSPVLETELQYID